MAKGKNKAKRKAKAVETPNVEAKIPEQELNDRQQTEGRTYQQVRQDQSCVGSFSLPIGISGEVCRQRVEAGLKKCYCTDGGCQCRECQVGRKKTKKALCLIAKVSGPCNVLDECKQCPRFKPCWTLE